MLQNLQNYKCLFPVNEFGKKYFLRCENKICFINQNANLSDKYHWLEMVVRAEEYSVKLKPSIRLKIQKLFIVSSKF